MSHTPLEDMLVGHFTPSVYEGISFIVNCGVFGEAWGIFQGYVGKIINQSLKHFSSQRTSPCQ